MSLGTYFESQLMTLGAEPAVATTTTPRSEIPPPRFVMIDGEKVFDVGFDHLASFPYAIVDAGTGATPGQIAEARRRSQVPDAVRRYDGQRVAISGYMLPVQMVNGRATKVILMRDQSTCCYGATPNMNDYVVVTVKGEGVKAVQDVPIVFVGVLHIGERYENGYLVALYEFDGEKLLGLKK